MEEGGIGGCVTVEDGDESRLLSIPSRCRFDAAFGWASLLGSAALLLEVTYRLAHRPNPDREMAVSGRDFVLLGSRSDKLGNYGDCILVTGLWYDGVMMNQSPQSRNHQRFQRFQAETAASERRRRSVPRLSGRVEFPLGPTPVPLSHSRGRTHSFDRSQS